MRECAWQHLSHEGLTLEDALDITLERLFSGPKLIARCVWIKEKQGGREGEREIKIRDRDRKKRKISISIVLWKN